MRKKMVVLFVLGILSGAVAVMMCGCNTLCQATIGAGKGVVQDGQSLWYNAGKALQHADQDTRDTDRRLNQ
jgi:hypothetical protein